MVDFIRWKDLNTDPCNGGRFTIIGREYQGLVSFSIKELFNEYITHFKK